MTETQIRGAQISCSTITNNNIANNTIDLTTKGTYVPVNKAGDTVTGVLTLNNCLNANTQRLVNVATPVDLQDAATKSYVDAKVQGLDWQQSVITISNDPPTGPNVGDRYIIGASPTGEWIGHANKIAEWGPSNAWVYTQPNEGYSVWVELLDSLYLFNGTAWIIFGSTTSHNILLGLQGGTTNEYYHLTQTQCTCLLANCDASSLHNHATLYYTKTNLQTSGQSLVHWDNVCSKPSTFPPSSHSHPASCITAGTFPAGVFSIASGGCLGVGTSPSALLEARGTYEGSLRLSTGTAGYNADFLACAFNNCAFVIRTNNTLILRTGCNACCTRINAQSGNFGIMLGGTDCVIVDSTGVGINASTPADQLHIRPIACAANQDGGIRISDTSNCWIARLAIRSDATCCPRFTINFNPPSCINENISIVCNKIGINKSYPEMTFDINGYWYLNDTDYPFILNIADLRGYNCPLTGGGISFSGYYTPISQAGWAGIHGYKANTTVGDYSGGLRFLVREHGSNPTERVRITHQGKVAINTTTPVNDSRLSVVDNVACSCPIATIINSCADAGARAIYASHADTGCAQFGVVSSNWTSNNICANHGYLYGSHGLTISTESTNVIRFLTNNTERVRITGAGLVGIGTTSPNALTVIDNSSNICDVALRVIGSSSGTTAAILTTSAGSTGPALLACHSDGGWAIQARTCAPTLGALHLYNSDTGYGLYSIAANNYFCGRVGIATTSTICDARLSATHSWNCASPIIAISNTVNGNAARAIYFAQANTATVQFGVVSSAWTVDGNIYPNHGYLYGSHGLTIYAGGNTPIRFTTNSAERMWISGTGLVGINCASPSCYLDVSGNSRITGCLCVTSCLGVGLNSGNFAPLEVRGPNNTSQIWWGNNASTTEYYGRLGYDGSGNTSVWLANANTYGSLFFRTGGDASANNRMVITNTGNVGIGTTSPVTTFHVAGSAYISAFLGVGTSSSAGGLLAHFCHPSADTCVLISSSSTSNSPVLILRNPGDTFGLYLGKETASGGNLVNGSTAYSNVITTPDARAMHFGTNHCVRMTITSDGLIGIGTTAPSYCIESRGTLAVCSNSLSDYCAGYFRVYRSSSDCNLAGISVSVTNTLNNDAACCIYGLYISTSHVQCQARAWGLYVTGPGRNYLEGNLCNMGNIHLGPGSWVYASGYVVCGLGGVTCTLSCVCLGGGQGTRTLAFCNGILVGVGNP